MPLFLILINSMTNIAFVFPGQGSQSVGMMNSWGDYQTIVSAVYEEASSTLGYDLWAIVSEGPDSRLNQTEITQPAMLCAGVASWRIMQETGSFPQPRLMAGHSLGEYSALVCAGAIELKAAVSLVASRGALMQAAVAVGEGSMAAIIGLDDDSVIDACARVETGVVEAVNFNAPGQVVIAGNKVAVEHAMENAKAAGAKRALPLPVSVPSHCSLMKEAADRLAEELDKVEIHIPQIAVIHNQNANVASNEDDIRDLLKKQLYQPVKWVSSVQFMNQSGVSSLVECGPGKVLSGLTRRIEKSMTGHAVYDLDSLNKTIELISA